MTDSPRAKGARRAQRIAQLRVLASFLATAIAVAATVFLVRVVASVSWLCASRLSIVCAANSIVSDLDSVILQLGRTQRS
jgi:hypothetical protein